jgi:hypothetical protein
MKFGVKTLVALVGTIAVMGTMAATPASACHFKRHCCHHHYKAACHHRHHHHHRHCAR